MRKSLIRSWKSALAFLHDIIMSGLALLIATYLRLGTTEHAAFQFIATVGLPSFISVTALCFLFSGMYRGIWSYASMNDLIGITKSSTIAILLFTLFMFLLNRLEDIPRSVPIITWLVLMSFLGGPRFAYRIARDRRAAKKASSSGKNKRVPVLLIGAGDGAELFVRAASRDRETAFQIIGVVDDQGSRVGRAIHGVPVLGTLEDLPSLLRHFSQQSIRPQRIVITRSGERLAGDVVRGVLNVADAHGIPVFRMPRVTDMTDSLHSNVLELRPIAIEDLLGRPPANLDRTRIEGLIKDADIAVTGAGGSIGMEISRQIAALSPARLLLIDYNEYNLYELGMEITTRFQNINAKFVLADVRDRDRIMRIFATEKPSLVFHAAALKHVPIVEANPLEGIHTNLIGTRNVADAALANGVGTMVLISTDKAVKPISIMGISKRLAEAYCQWLGISGKSQRQNADAGTRFVTVRFGNVLGSAGSVIPLFQRQLTEGGPLTVTHPEVERYFMTIREAVLLVLQATVLGLELDGYDGEIHVLDMGQPVKIVDLARTVIELSGLRPDIDIKITYTGLRPGEKLSEELFDDGEIQSETGIDGVFVAVPRVEDVEYLRNVGEELQVAVKQGNEDAVRRILSVFGQHRRLQTERPLDIASALPRDKAS